MRTLVHALTVLAAVSGATTLHAAGTVTSLASRGLPGPVRVWVKTPPTYDTETARRFPVVYFLHDAQGDESILERRGVADALYAAMRSGQLPEVILVAPRGTGTWFVDSFDGKARYATFLTTELVPWVDGRLRTHARRESRAVVGISMGGYGALRWALATHEHPGEPALGTRPPGLFAAAGGLSPAVQQLTWRALQGMPFHVRGSLERVFGGRETENGLEENDLYAMLLSRPELSGKAPRIHLRCGTEDSYRLAGITAFLSRFLTSVDVPNRLVLEPGAHDWTYWRVSLPRLLADVSQELVRDP